MGLRRRIFQFALPLFGGRLGKVTYPEKKSIARGLELDTTVEVLLKNGAMLAKTGNLTKAQKIFDEVIRISPGNPAGLHMAAIVASTLMATQIPPSMATSNSPT